LTVRPSALNILAGNTVYSGAEEFSDVFQEKWKGSVEEEMSTTRSIWEDI
jgi:hypothetical protein